MDVKVCYHEYATIGLSYDLAFQFVNNIGTELLTKGPEFLMNKGGDCSIHVFCMIVQSYSRLVLQQPEYRRELPAR